MELLRFIIIMVVITTTRSTKRGKRANHCSLDNLNILNGSYEVKSGGGIIVYECDHGFSMLGVPRLFCTGSIWSNRFPKCIANTCHTIPKQRPLRVQESKKYGGALLEFSCEVMYRLVGRKQITCDGTSWSATTPTCEPFSPPTKCDFEDAGLCGWEHHDSSDVRWAIHSGDTKTSRTGPTYDHTIGARGTGHYMYFETSSPTQKGHKAVLISPLYPGNYSGRCFTFWYHLLAEKDVSLLQVKVKPVSKSLRESNLMFAAKENKGDKWLENTFQVPDLHEPFQIQFIATRGASIRSDIAIDDVSLYLCPTTYKETSTIRISSSKTSTGTSLKESLSTTTKANSTPSKMISTRTTGVKLPATTQENTGFTFQNPTSGRSSFVSLRHVTKAASKDVRTNSTSSSSSDVLNYHGSVKGNSTDTTYLFVGIGIGLTLLVLLAFLLYYRRRRKRAREDYDGYLRADNPLYVALNGDHSEALIKTFDK